MRKLIVITTAGVLLAAPMVSSATGSVGVGVKAGSLGAGVEVSYPISSMLTVGVGINKYSKSWDTTADGVDYQGDLNLQTISLLANFHPFSGSFHLTAGAMINNNEVKMEADPSTSYDIGGTTYTLSQVGTLSGKVNFNKVAPYAGFGWGTSSDSGIGFTLDIGVLMQGKPNVDFDATGTLASDPGFQADLKQEEANAEDDIKDFTMYPVISAGIDIRF